MVMRNGAEEGEDPVLPRSGRRSRAGLLATDRGADENWLRRLRLVGIALPVGFIVVLQALRPAVFDRYWPVTGDLIVSVLTALAALAFGIMMFAVIGRGHRQVLRRNGELAAVNDVLLTISRGQEEQHTAERIRANVAQLLRAQESGYVHTPVPPNLNVLDCDETDLWVARRDPFEPADRSTLATFGRLGALAQEHARMSAARREGDVLTERLRIARELHDSLAQVLAVAHLQLTSLTSREQIAGTPVAGELEELARVCREAHADVRESIFGLRETTRGELSLVEGLERCLQTFETHAGIQARLVVEDAELLADPDADAGPDEVVGRDPRSVPGADAVTLPAHSRAQVLRLVQEALTNVRKHARASRATVRISRQGQATLVTVEDDGCGFDPGLDHRDLADQRFGLRSMRERAEEVAGQFTVESRPGEGTRIVVLLPDGPAG